MIHSAFVFRTFVFPIITQTLSSLCVHPESEPRYIYSIGHSVMRADVTIDDNVPQVIQMQQRPLATSMERVQAIGFDYEEELVYFSDTGTDVIYRVSANGGPLRELTVQTKHVEGTL